MNTEQPTQPAVVLSTALLCPAPSLRVAIFDWLCLKYVQRADTRQESMGLQYMEAETHDLAEEIAARFEAELTAQREELLRSLGHNAELTGRASEACEGPR